MAATKFTPGPWATTLTNDCAIVGADGWPVAETGVGQDYDEHFERMEADARLIKAAPDLFEALQELVRVRDAYSSAIYIEDVCDADEAYEKAIEMARAALSKATGEQA